MKHIGLKEIRIDSLRLPGDWTRRLASDHVKELARSLDEVPLLQAPGVRKDTLQILWGRDRVAASHLRGDARIMVNVWDCTDLEALWACDTENAFRRAPDLEARRRLIARALAASQDDAPAGAVQQAPQAPLDSADAPRKRGRPPSAKGKALAKVASETGVTKGAIEKQLSREAAPKKKPSVKAKTRREASSEVAEEGGRTLVYPEEPAPHAPLAETPSTEAPLGTEVPIETWGCETDPGVMQMAYHTRRTVDDVVSKLTTLIGAITRALGDLDVGGALASLDLERVRQNLRQEASILRAKRPMAVCPYCKAIPALAINCRGCGALMLVGKAAVDRAPEELLRRGAEAGVFLTPDKFCKLVDVPEDDIPF